jgi:aerobic-type carbon monoxide dehydrogenase small subunit (CoxS/CutS family)
MHREPRSLLRGDPFKRCRARVFFKKALLGINTSPSEDEIKTALAGNVYLVLVYTHIIEAVHAAAGEMVDG